jgi:hypothetical protein
VLGGTDGPSSLAASMSTVVELLKDCIDPAATNGVHCVSRFALVAPVSHFPELKTDLEVLGFGRIVDLTKDEADALWTWVRAASNLLASYVPSSIARNPPDGMGRG